jgi:hypothetical protein
MPTRWISISALFFLIMAQCESQSLGKWQQLSGVDLSRGTVKRLADAGETRDEIIRQLGNPATTSTIAERTWLTYLGAKQRDEWFSKYLGFQKRHSRLTVHQKTTFEINQGRVTDFSFHEDSSNAWLE